MALEVHGARLFGKVDAVPGVLHVGTRFLHAWLVPLVPTASFVVIDEGQPRWLRKEEQLIKLPSMSWRSVALAYFRTLLGLVLFAAAVVLAALIGIEAPVTSTLGAFTVAAGAVLVLGLTYWWGRATPERLDGLEKAGMPADLIERARVVVREGFATDASMRSRGQKWRGRSNGRVSGSSITCRPACERPRSTGSAPSAASTSRPGLDRRPRSTCPLTTAASGPNGIGR